MSSNIPKIAVSVVAASMMLMSLHASSEIIFNQPVDHRYAWIGNEAEGSADFQARLISMIRDANVSIEVSTMSFTVTEIGDELAAAAERGVAVRIHGNANHRYQPGYHTTMKGQTQVLDNNLPALVHRVNFQQSATPAPAGFLIDTGEPYGPKSGGLSYGWTTNVSGLMQSHTGIVPSYTSAALGDVYVQDNDLDHSWEISVPNGYYYAYVMAGHPTQQCNTNVKLEGSAIFYKNNDPGFNYVASTDPDDHESSPVAGGRTSDGNLNGKRVQVSDGKLTLQVGYPVVEGNSCLDFIEIYRGSTDLEGNNATDKQYVQQKQLIHAKYMIFDAGTAGQKLWASSGNLTGGLFDMSEDALVTDENAVINMFLADFNVRWGSATFLPNAANAFAGRFKPAPASTTASIYNADLNANFQWYVYFSPTNISYNMYDKLADYIDTSDSDLLFVMEQFTSSGNLTGTPYGTLFGTDVLRENHLKDNFLDLGKELYGVFGNQDATDEIFNLNSYANADLVQVPYTPTYSIHTKAVLSDTLYDTRHSREGRVLMGAMNWSQSAMHINDEHTLIIEDPMLANQYLQRAIAALGKEGITPSKEADIILVLDRSYSMNQSTPSGATKIEATRVAASLFVDLLETNSGHRVSIVRFGETIEPFVPAVGLSLLTPTYVNTLQTAIANTDATLPIGNATCYGAGLGNALEQFRTISSPKPRRLIHFFTDGKENRVPYASAVADDLYAESVEVHSTAFGEFDIYGSGSTAVLADLAANSGGTFAQLPDNPVLLQKRFAEVARDAMKMSTVLDPSYTIKDGRSTFETSFVVDKGMETLKILAMWDKPIKRLASLKIITPDGKTLKPFETHVRLSEANGYLVWHIDLLALTKMRVNVYGKWHVVGEASEGFKGQKSATVDVMVLGDGGVEFDAEAYTRPKEPNIVHLLARTLRGQKMATNMSVTAIWQPPVGAEYSKGKEITLYDDGKHGDKAAGDGIFGNRFKIGVEGNHAFRFIAKGGGRRQFQREEIKYITTSSKGISEEPKRDFWRRFQDWIIFWK